jgi:hypothetical protein
MKKRQYKKWYIKDIIKEFSVCQYCGKEPKPDNEYFKRYNTCDKHCYADMVGVSLYE